MADLSLEARHLLRVMRTGGSRREPLRGAKEWAAMEELHDAEMVAREGEDLWVVTSLGYSADLT
jgi:hypothetical protein